MLPCLAQFALSRIELLDGSLIAVPPMGPGHACAARQLAKLMVRRFGELAHVSVQGPVALDAWSEPQPDVMLSAPPDERYASVHPQPEDALLVIEVALSSLRFDAGSSCAHMLGAACGNTGSWISSTSG